MTSFTICDDEAPTTWVTDTIRREGDLIVQVSESGRRVEYTLKEAQQMIDAFTTLINQENK